MVDDQGGTGGQPPIWSSRPSAAAAAAGNPPAAAPLPREPAEAETESPSPATPTPDGPTTGSGQRRNRALGAGLTLAVLVAAAVLLGTKLGRRSEEPSVTALTTSATTASRLTTAASVPPLAATSSPTPTPRARSTTARPAGRVSQGGIDLSAVVANSVTPVVAALLDKYFASVNDHDTAVAVSLFDPAGVIDNRDPAQVSKFESDTATTRDSNVVVRKIASRSGGLLVTVTFRSEQDPTLGPDGEACTQWRLTYKLTPYRVSYRILGATDVASPSC